MNEVKELNKVVSGCCESVQPNPVQLDEGGAGFFDCVCCGEGNAVLLDDDGSLSISA